VEISSAQQPQREILVSDQHKAALTILRRKQVQARTGLSRSTIYLKISKGEFPPPIALGARAVGWLSSAIDQWIEQCVAASRKSV
jgi:prophage regulatory protein